MFVYYVFFQISGQAPLAPELAMKEQLHAQKREDLIKKDITSGKQKKKDKEKKMELLANVDISDDPVHNDFKRELLFYRQAQSAVLEALPRLKSMKIPTKRPQDYFAQMAKTDEHMQKVHILFIFMQ
jgi:rRNA-processing protein EBP2